MARLYLRDPRGAIEAWEEAVRLNPRQYEALLNIGIVAVELGDPQRAREALARFVEIAPAARYAADIARARSILARLEP